MTAEPVEQRLPALLPADLTGEQAELYESIAHGPRSRGPQLFALTDPDGSLQGPFRAMLLSPSFGAALQELGATVRYCGDLADRAREIAILVVGHYWHSDFEVYAHEAVGQAAGLTPAELALLADGRLDDLADPTERVVAMTASALCSSSDLSEVDFVRARSVLGDRVLFELTTLIGYYATLALQLRVYRIRRPESATRSRLDTQSHAEATFDQRT